MNELYQREYSCRRCDGTGLEPVFIHIKAPADAPAQRSVTVDAFDHETGERHYEDGRSVHALLEGFRICGCEAGTSRSASAISEKQSSGRGLGKQQRRGFE